MIWTCFRHEWTLLLRAPRLLALLLATLLLVAGSTWWSVATERRQLDAQRQAAATARADWLAQGEVHPHRMAHFGDYVFRPGGPLARIDAGIQGTTGRVVRVEAHRQNSALHASSRAAGPLGRGGRFDPAFLLQVLGSLLILLLGGVAAADERDSGRLRWLLGQGASAWSILLGRVLMLGTVGLALLAVVAVGVLAADGGALALEHAGRLLALLGLYGVFYAVLACLAVSVGAWTRSGSGGLLVLLVGWILATVVLPRATASLASEWTPLPTREAFESAMKEARSKGLDGHNPRDQRMAALERRVLATYGVEKLEDLPIDIGGIRMQADEEFGHKVWDEHYGRLHATLLEQGRVGSVAALVNPLQLVESTSMTLAGTDLLHELRFRREVEHYRRRLVGALNREHAYGKARNAQGHRIATAEFFAKLEPYRHRQPALREALEHRALELSGLVGWLVVGLLAIGLSARRLERGLA